MWNLLNSEKKSLMERPVLSNPKSMGEVVRRQSQEVVKGLTESKQPWVKTSRTERRCEPTAA